MSRQNDEIERLKRLRERQLAARDPRARDRAFYGNISRRRKSKRLTLGNLIADFQAKWTWMAAGGLIGAIAAVALYLIVRATWAEYVGYVLVLFGIVVGRLLGAVRDWGDEDWDR